MNGGVAQNDVEYGRWCDICAQTGRKVKLQYFQINYEDAVLICPVKECTYPLDSKPLDNIIVKRKPEDIVSSIKRKRRKIDHNQLGKQVIPLISRKSMVNTGLDCANSALRSCTLTSQSAEVIENVSQNDAASFLSVPVYNSQDFSNYSASILSSVHGECLSSLGLPETSTPSVFTSFSLLPPRQSDVSATSPALVGCELKTKRLAAAPTAVDYDMHHHTAASHEHMAELSSAQISLGRNSVNPVILDPNHKKYSINLPEQNSMIPFKIISRGSEKSDALNGFKMKVMDLSKQNLLGSLKWESFNPDKAVTLNLAEPDVVKQNSLLDSEKHSKEYCFANREVHCSAVKGNTQNESKSVPPKEVHLKFLQWINKDSLCWLDAVMCLLTHCKMLRLWLSKGKTEACLKLLISSFDISQRLFRQGLELRRCVVLCQMGRTVKLETSVGDVMVKTGGGNSSDILFGARAIATIAMDEVEGCNTEEPFDVRNIFSREDPTTVSIEKMLQEADRLDSLSKKTLSDARDSIFASLEPSLHCKKGQNDSPLMALMELLATDPAGESLKIRYHWTLNCSVCKTTHQDSVSKEVVTFLKLPENFNISGPCFLRKCFSCKAPDQLLCIEFERLPDLFFHHFNEGIRHSDLADLDFEFRGEKYAVTGLVQYKINPDHFVPWLREPIVDYWMECDDLKNCICKFSDSRPTIPASQVHIIMWEKQSRNSGYRLPCERESLKKVERVQQTAEAHVLSNQFPPSVMTSLPAVSANPTSLHVPVMTSFPAVTALRPSPGAAVCASVHSTLLKGQDENSSKLARKTTDSTRLQRMKQKFELDRRRSSNLNSSKPVIPRIPVNIYTVGEQPNRKAFLSLPGKVDLSGGRYSPSKITSCNTAKKLSRTLVQCVEHENGTAKSNARAGRHNIAALQTRSMLKVGRQSYLETILPLIKGNKPSLSALQTFDAYVPKSQKVTPYSVNEATASSATVQGNAGLDTKIRKPKVCFSESSLQDVKQYQLPETVTNGVSLNQMRTKGGILAKSCVLPRFLSQSALIDPKFVFSESDLDFSNFMDLDKILFEGDNSMMAENTLNITSDIFPLVQNNSRDVSNCNSASIGSTSGLISTNGISLNVLSVMQENTAGFESKVFGETLAAGVHSSVPDLGDFILPENWPSLHSGFSEGNISTYGSNSSVMNSSSSNNAFGNYVKGNASGVNGYPGISDNGVTYNPSALPSVSGVTEDFTNLPLPVQSFNFDEEDWSWFS